jgi:hypothetical protein
MKLRDPDPERSEYTDRYLKSKGDYLGLKLLSKTVPLGVEEQRLS